MSPYAITIIIITILLGGRSSVAYPHGASGGASPPSPTHNSKIQRASATPTPGESPFPNAKRLPDTKNALPNGSLDSVVGSGDAIQELNLKLDNVLQNSTTICTQGSGSQNIAVPTMWAVYDIFHSVWSLIPLKITIIWLFFGSVFLLSLKGVRCASRIVVEIGDCWFPKESGTKNLEEKELEKPPGRETTQISNKLQDRGWPVYILSVIAYLLRLLSCCAQTQVEG